MPKSHPPYPPEYRRRMVELVRAGRGPEDLAREFEPSAQAIRNWVQQADLDEGRRQDGLTTDERGELNKLRRENRTLRLEREILKNFRARSHLLLNEKLPHGILLAAREGWPLAYWCLGARKKTWSGGGCGLDSGDAVWRSRLGK